MKRRRPNFLAPAMLALEAQQVIGLRMMKLAFGGSAARSEARRMVQEKVEAAGAAAAILATDPAGGPDRVVTMLRRRVRANRKRLGGF